MYLFGEFGELKKFVKISRRQIITFTSLDITVLEIAKLIIHQIAIFEKPPNIIATKYSHFTVTWSSSFYSRISHCLLLN